MTHIGISPNVFTYNILIRPFSGAAHLPKVLTFYDMLKSGCLPNIVSYNTLIDVHFKLGMPDHAINLFYSLKSNRLQLNLITYNSMINRLCCEGKMKTPLRWLMTCIARASNPTSVLINGLNKQAWTKEAKQLLLKMFYDDSVHSGITYETLIKSCSDIEFKSGVALSKGFCTKGLMKEAYRVFESMLRRDHNVLIHGHSKCQNSRKAYSPYKDMVGFGFSPHTLTVIALIEALYIGDMSKELEEALNNMLRRCKLTDAEFAKVLVEVNHEEGNMDGLLMEMQF